MGLVGTSRSQPDNAELETLRLRIAALENRPALASPHSGEEAGDGLALLAPPAGLLHEVFADEQRAAGAALGFALGMARSHLGGGRTAILYLELVSEVQEVGMPYAHGLASYGIDPGQLVIGRAANPAQLFWAMEEAIACRSVAAVIADLAAGNRGLDFTASRRLSLRAAAAGTSALLLRYGREREASAAQLRWRVRPAPSRADPYDQSAPGRPRFLVDIEKRRLGGGRPAPDDTTLILDWTGHGFVAAQDRRQPAAPHRWRTAPSRPQPAALGDRLSEAS